MRRELKGRDVYGVVELSDHVSNAVPGREDVSGWTLINHRVSIQFASTPASELSYPDHGDTWTATVHVLPYLEGVPEPSPPVSAKIAHRGTCSVAQAHQVTIEAHYHPTPVGPLELLGTNVLHTTC